MLRVGTCDWIGDTWGAGRDRSLLAGIRADVATAQAGEKADPSTRKRIADLEAYVPPTSAAEQTPFIFLDGSPDRRSGRVGAGPYA